MGKEKISAKKRGRPSTGFNKSAYMKEYMRKRREEQKLASKSFVEPQPKE